MICPQEKANEFCSVQHIANSILGRGPAFEIAAMLGLPDHDERWCTPWGQDVTYLCVRSDIGGFASKAWTIHGWVLDEESMCQLQEEFPDEWFLGVTCSLGFPCDYSEVLRLRHSSLAVRGNMSDGRANYRSGGGNHAAVAVPQARFRFKVSPRLRWRSRGGGPVEAM